ncbi:MAG: glycosyltransferase [Chloroflexi bacterium]|nr:glycosyltransferase [Chloroflexota bacterium]
MERAALPSSWVQRALEIVVGLVSVLLMTSPMWAGILFPRAWSWAFLGFAIYWLAKTANLAFQSVRTVRTMQTWDRYPWAEQGRRHPRWRRLHHLVVFPTYQEPLAVLEESLGYLLRQDVPRDRIAVLVAFEARDIAAPLKAKQLHERFGHAFGRFWTTSHPLRSGEVPGKAANLAYAVPRATRALVEEVGVALDDVLVTICDADSRLHPKYLSAVACQYLTGPPGQHHLYQPAVLFHVNLHRVPGPFRVLNGLYSAILLAKLGRKHSLVSQSTYSLGLATCAAVNYWDVDVISEDSHLFFKVFLRLGPGVTVRPIFLPVWADAAEGRTGWATLQAHYRQTRRWAWGIADVPYLLWHGARAAHLPRWQRGARIGQYVKEHLLWTSHWFLLTGGLNFVAYAAPASADTAQAAQIQGWVSVLLLACLPGLLVVAWVDRQVRARYAPPSPPPERWPHLAHWLLLPVVGFFAAVLPGVDAHLRLLVGRRLAYEVTAKLAPASDTATPPTPATPGQLLRP